jgi:hypothetical protein
MVLSAPIDYCITRWDPKYQTVDMAKVPHRVLTKPKKV